MLELMGIPNYKSKTEVDNFVIYHYTPEKLIIKSASFKDGYSFDLICSEHY